MRVFKPKYKRKGRWVDVKKWWIEVRDRRDREIRKLLRFPAGTENAQLAKGLGRKIETLIDYAAMGEPNPDLIDWFQNYKSATLQDKLIKAGLLPVRVKEASRPLIEYLPEFEKSIIGRKARTKGIQARTTAVRVCRIIGEKGCQFNTWDDVSADSPLLRSVFPKILPMDGRAGTRRQGPEDKQRFCSP